MVTRTDRRQAIVLAAAVAALTFLPYLAAGGLAAPGMRFSGFLVNPLDGFSYLAKMRQGADGAWSFVLPYAAQPGSPVPLFLFYLLLGHVQTWLGLAPMAVFHAARSVGAIVMFLCAWRFLEGVLVDRRAVWTSYALVLLGGGLGWLALPLGLAASDLTIPESVPFLTSLVNPHFPLAAAALFLVMDSLGPRDIRAGWRWFTAFCAGAVLGILLPFVLVAAVAVPAAWLAVETWLGRGEVVRREWLRARWLGWIGLCLGAGPWIVYGVWLTQAHPVLRIWQLQNQTPSPAPLAYLFGFAIPLVGMALGWREARPHRCVGGRLLLTWMLVNAVLLYVPGLMQRRLTLGLALPLDGLAGMCVAAWLRQDRPLRLAVVLALVLGLPSPAIVAAAGLSSVARSAAISVISEADVRAMAWAEQALPRGALLLASPLTGNRLPALVGSRVIYGHPFETPYAQSSEATVLRLLDWSGAPAEALAEAQALGVDFVYIGGAESSLAQGVRWWEELPAAYQAAGVAIYQVPAP